MNTNRLILSAATVVACLVPHVLKAGLFNYVRPVVAVAEPTEKGAESSVGGFIQIGGGDESVDLCLEGGWLNFDQTIKLDEVYSGRGEIDFVPLLATVKWRANFDSKGSFALLIGPSAGLSYVDATVKVFEEGVRIYRIRETDWLFTYGIDAALQLAPSKGFDLTIGYKFLIANGITFEDESVRADSGDLKTHVLYAGIGFRF